MVEAGYRVIRFDNRGVGLSGWVENWEKKAPYALEDMAGDAIAILDELEIQQAHVIGVSMGGMIGQSMAINTSERVSSLTSIMSSGYYEDPELPRLSTSLKLDFARVFLKYGFRQSESKALKLGLAIPYLLKGTGNYTYDDLEILNKNLYELRKRNGYNPKVNKQHTAAISASGSRYDGLKHLTIPTLIVHGSADRLIDIAHGKKCAALIPGADSLWIEGMGHDIPEEYAGRILEAVYRNFEKGKH